MSEVLISFPFAELYVVRGSDAPQLESDGELIISSLPSVMETGEEGGTSAIQIAVGKVAWEVRPSSKALKAGEYTWVFDTQEPGVFYSLTLLSSAGDEDVGIFEAVLENIAVVRESTALLEDPAAQTGEAAIAGAAYKSALARGVHKASAGIASGLLVSAAYATGALSRVADAARPAAPTSSPLRVSEQTQRRFQRTAAAAEWASGAAGAVVGGLAWVGAKVAGGALWALGADKPLKQGEEAGVLRETSHAAAAGFMQVWDGMEDAGRAVLLSARDNTARVVEERYGADAAGLSVHSMNAAGAGVNTVYAVRKLGVRTVAKAAAKRTAKGVFRQMGGSGTDAASKEAQDSGRASASQPAAVNGKASASQPAAVDGKASASQPAAVSGPSYGQRPAEFDAVGADQSLQASPLQTSLLNRK